MTCKQHFCHLDRLQNDTWQMRIKSKVKQKDPISTIYLVEINSILNGNSKMMCKEQYALPVNMQRWIHNEHSLLSYYYILHCDTLQKKKSHSSKSKLLLISQCRSLLNKAKQVNRGPLPQGSFPYYAYRATKNRFQLWTRKCFTRKK